MTIKERRGVCPLRTLAPAGGLLVVADEGKRSPGFRVQGAGCRVQGAGCRVQGSGFTLCPLRALAPAGGLLIVANEGKR